MDSTKEEALRLKGIVEQRIQSRDYMGARAAILKSQSLFPDLEFAPHMLSLSDVLWAAETEFPGYGIDWYWVLQLPPSATDAQIVAQYQKLTSLLESVQTQFRNAASAVTLVKDAYLVLSNWAKRSEFDLKRMEFGKTGGSSDLGLLVGSKLMGREGGNRCPSPADAVFDESSQRSVSGKSILKRVRGGSFYSDEQRANKASGMATDFVHRKKCFAQDQIWAVFSGRDAMPQQYVKVHDVISASKLCVTALEPNPTHYSEICWVEEDLPLGCGVFKLDRTTFNLEKGKLSHLVHCDCSPKKFFYNIYPRKGQIWALYKNWHKKWRISDYENCQREVVEILQDFDDEMGLGICRLVQLKGCKTFFQRQLVQGVAAVCILSKMEMLGFSHQIPASTVLFFEGIERYGIPKGSWQLEPDALPYEFL